MGILLTVVVFGVLIVAFAHEVLEFGHARRRGAVPADFQRFRRRSLGLSLVGVLTLMLLAMGVVEDLAGDVATALLGYYGMCILVAGWIMLVALRDMRATMESAIEEKQRITLDHISEVEQAMVARRAERRSPASDPAPAPVPAPTPGTFTDRTRERTRRTHPGRRRRPGG